MMKLSSWKTICFLYFFCVATVIASSAQAGCSWASPCFMTLVSFDTTDGAYLSLVFLVQGTDGNFYGVTGSGGAHGDGTVFKITPQGALTTLHNFVGTDGSSPVGGLTLATSGNFYGTTSGGRVNGDGTVFKMTQSDTLTPLHSFNGTDGSGPASGVVQASDGNFYGTTQSGGSSTNCSGGCGTVFKITPGGTLTTLHSFDGTDGEAPIAGLVQAADGNFYGITYAGGTNNDGVIFKITPTGSVTALHNFDGTDGANSYGSLIQATNGNLYGMTAFGGANQCNLRGTLVGCGTIFKITLSGAFTILHNFDGTDGAFPSAALTQATDGNLYGGTYQGGGNGVGTVFKLASEKTLSTLHTFDTTDGIDANALLQATNGNFYGTTLSGGTSGVGTVFSLSEGLGPFVKTLPTSGKVGTLVIILGNNLTGSTNVTFNGTAAKFTVFSSTEIKTNVPSGATTGKVKVTTPSRTLTSNVNFRVTPTISSFSPTSGPPGTSVTINGESFTGATSVTFGGIKATSLVVNSYTKITATVPSGAKTGKIIVTTPGGTATSSGTFTVT